MSSHLWGNDVCHACQKENDNFSDLEECPKAGVCRVANCSLHIKEASIVSTKHLEENLSKLTKRVNELEERFELELQEGLESAHQRVLSQVEHRLAADERRRNGAR